MATTALEPSASVSPLLRSFWPLAVSLLMLGTGIALAPHSLEAEDVVDGVAAMSFPVVGGWLLLRGLSPAIARIFGATGLLIGLSFLAGGYSETGAVGGGAAEALTDIAFVAVMTLLLNVLLLVFPDGRPPSRRWRPLLWLALASFVTAVASMLVPLHDAVELAALIGFAVLAFMGLVSLLWRLRDTDPVRRRRVAWFLGGATVLVTLFLLDGTLQDALGPVYGVLSPILAIPAVPVATALAFRDQRPGVTAAGTSRPPE